MKSTSFNMNVENDWKDKIFKLRREQEIYSNSIRSRILQKEEETLRRIHQE